MSFNFTLIPDVFIVTAPRSRPQGERSTPTPTKSTSANPKTVTKSATATKTVPEKTKEEKVWIRPKTPDTKKTETKKDVQADQNLGKPVSKPLLLSSSNPTPAERKSKPETTTEKKKEPETGTLIDFGDGPSKNEAVTSAEPNGKK